MATNEFDFEYGPTPEGADHEHTDIEPALAWKFGLWLGVAMLISASIVYGTFWFFEGREQAVNQAAQVFPLAAGRIDEPPAPQLQTQPFKDIYMLRQSEQDRLTGYGWVDKGSGTAHIPIDHAMRLVIEQGMVRGQPQVSTVGAGQIMTDSSSGRMAVPR